MNKTTRPIKKKNAIDACAFVLNLSREISSSEQKNILDIYSSLSDEYDDFQEGIRVRINADEKTEPSLQTEKFGLTLSKRLDGKLLRVCRIEAQRLVIICHEYECWEETWSHTKRVIKAFIDHFSDLSDIQFTDFILQYIDKFIDSGVYNKYNVFRKNSYFSKHILEQDRYWHTVQGWFEELSFDTKILHTLKMGTTPNDNDVITTIDHAMMQQVDYKISMDSINNKIEEIYETLHLKNKEVFCNIINNRQLKRVGAL
jgi:uncharacterized protein (TIGR04255 family)